MRVSDHARYNGFVPRFHDLLSRQVDVQRQISGGYRILRPSDAPGDAAVANQLQSQVQGLEQHLRNTDEALNWADQTQIVLESGISILQRANELAIEGGGAILSASDRADIARAVDQLLETMVSLGDQTSRGRHLFSGTQTDQAAFTTTRDAQGQITSVSYAGDAGGRKLELSEGRVVTTNMLGSNESGGSYGAFRDIAAGVDLFDTMIQMRDFLDANDAASLAAISQPEVRAGIAHLTLGLARVGGLQAGILEAGVINEGHLANTQERLSTLAETDIAEAAIEAAELDTAYRAALEVASRVMQTGLLQYLR